MNKTFRSLWSAALQTWVAVAETVAARGKRSSGVAVATAAMSLLGLASGAAAQTAPPPAALPTGGQVAAGQASISQSGATLVIQQSSDRAAIHWQQFNVGSGAQVQFQQPSASSVTLNRVLGSDPSQIFGRITANGQVVLTNPAGVYFGPSARVDVGGLIATTQGIGDADFMAGGSRYERGGSTASVVNEGELKAALGGYIALLAPEVRNQGAIIAQMGTVALASGEAVDLRFDSSNRLTSVRVEPSQIQALVDNRHAVQAPGGLIILAAQSMTQLLGGLVKNSGAIEAAGLQQQGGRIVLAASTRVEQAGTLDASSASAQGGQVSLSAGTIELQDASRIHASGATGGGTVRVGGGWQGEADPLLASTLGDGTAQAHHVRMAAGATIDASATQQGDGGAVVLWSDIHQQDGHTTARGSVSARGGASGGKGGRVETSGQGLDIDGFQVDTLAAQGQAGLWLIDPYDYNIGSSQAATISTALNTSSVTVTTTANNAGYGANGNIGSTGNITVSSAITNTGGAGTSLTLDAANQVDLAASISITGDVSISAATVVGAGNIALANGRGLTITQSGASTYYGTISGTNATFTKNGAGDLGLGGASTYTGATTVNGGVLSLAAANRLSDSTALTVNANGTFSLNGFNETVGSISGTGLIVNGAVIRDGLVLWLDAGNTASYGGSGNTWYDLSGNGYNATLYGSPTYSSATSLFSFTTNTQYAQVTALPANFLGSTPTGVTVFTVANFGGANIWERVVDFGNGAPNQNIILSRYGTENRLNWEIYNGAGGAENKTGYNTAIINNQKMSFAGTADGSNLRVYADGSLNTTTASSALPAAVARNDNYIGKSNWIVDDTFRGDIGTVMVYDRALSAAEIAKNHQLLFNRSAATLTVGGNNASTNFSGRIENGVGTLSLVKAGSGTLALSGANNYAGSTTVTGGTLSINADNRLGTVPSSATAGHLTLNGGALAGANSFTLHANRGLALGGNHGTLEVAHGATLSYGGVITGSGNLGKAGAGSLVLSGASSYTGATHISDGALRLGSSGDSVYSPLGTTAAGTTVSSGGALDLAGYTLGTAEPLTLSGTGVSSSGALYNSTSTGVSYAGGITLGANATVKGGAGALALNGTVNGAYQLDITTTNAGFTQNGVVGGTTPLAGYSVNTGTGAVTLGSTVTAAGPISVTGGNIAINAGLVSTGTGSNALITLQGSGNVTDGPSGYVQTGSTGNGSLLLLGGNVTLDNSASNDVYTLAASGVSGLTLLDKAGLQIGTVGTTQGVSASGVVNIGTQLGSLSITRDVTTTSTAGNALTLNASIGSAVGADTSYNLLFSGSPTISVGSGGTGRLYSGGLAGSTGLTSLGGLSAGNGRFRYNADETTNFSSGSWTALGSGLYGIYREQPSATLTATSTTITYGDSPVASTTATGLVNGDALVLTPTSGQYSGAGVLKASATPYSFNHNLTGLGYSVSGSTGTVTVNRKSLTVSGLTTANKVYDGTRTATVGGTAALQSSVAAGSGTSIDGKAYTGDAVSISGTATGTFNDKDVLDATTVSFAGLGLAGSDAGNYTLTPHADASASITARAVSLAATKTYDGTAAFTGNQLSITTGVGSETLSYSGAVANSKHVAPTGKYLSALTLLDGSNGGVASNYQLPSLTAASAGNAVTINAATLVPTLTNTGVSKTYDATTNAPAGFTPSWSFSGLASGDTGAALSFTSASYNDATVAGASTVTVGGLGISSISGTNGSMASDYALSASSRQVAAAITKATLTVRANNDAKFVTQSDPVNFAGVSYSGFVGGETTSALGGAATVTRSNASTSTAGTYPGVLQPGGLTAANYQFDYVGGDFTIVPSSQLLVRVNDVSNTYGTATQYTVSSVAYDNGGNVVRLDNGSVSGSSVSVSGNVVTVNDGASGVATFTLSPQAGQYSTASKLKAGSYQIGLAGAVTENSANFSDTVTVVGAHQVATQALTASASGGVSKAYDGTAAMSGVTLALATLVPNDVVSVSGVGSFVGRNVGSNLSYTISNLALSGADAGNYHLSGGNSFSGSNGSITAKTVTLAPQAASRVYNGATGYTATEADLAYLSGLLGVSGDAVTAATLGFADKNVGTGKTLTASSATVSDGNNGNNYTITLGSNGASSITRLNSVTWIGGASGNWFDPANWAGGAVPDRGNVAQVVIPANVTVSFDTTGAVAPADASAAVQVDSLGTAGSLSQSNGTLNVGAGGITLAQLTQTGGTLTNAGTTTLDSFTQGGGSFSGTGPMTAGQFSQTGGNTSLSSHLTVTQGFSQGTSGSLSIGGNASLTDTSGGLQLGNLSTMGNLTASSTGGAITQAGGTALTVRGNSSFAASNGAVPADITLDNAGNDFTGTVDLSGATVSVRDANGLALGLVTTTGNLTLQSDGALDLGTSSVGGTLNANSGNGNITQAGALRVAGPANLQAGSGSITLTHPGNQLQGQVTARGARVALRGDKASEAGAAQGQMISAVAPPSRASANFAVATAVGAAPVVQLQGAAGADASLMVTVQVSSGLSTAGAGFSFELPAQVQAFKVDGGLAQASQANGAGLPAWLRFDAAKLRFEASAVPDGGFPLQLTLVVGGRTVTVVISERSS